LGQWKFIIIDDEEDQMQRTVALSIAALALLCLSVPGLAQDCIFKSKEDDSLKLALKNFHDVMRVLVHGPAEKGDFTQVRARAQEFEKLRDGILAAHLPQKLSSRCSDISAKARALSAAVDGLMAQSRSAEAEAEALKSALDKVHTGYRELNNSLTTLDDLLEAFHDLMHPLWHESYPSKDAAAIKAQVPRLKVRARLIVSTAEAADKMKLKRAQSLLDAVTILEEATAADDDLAVLEGLKLVHTAYENLAEHH
jgi:hypothetical protein